MHFLVLPTTLFKPPNDCTTITYIEEPYYMNDTMHPNKLILHRASMKYHQSMQSVITYYYSIDRIHTFYMNNVSTSFVAYDPIDKELKNTLHKKCNITFYDSPGFLMTYDMIRRYEKENGKLHQTSFYFWLLQYINVPRNVDKSYDQQNRKKLPKNHEPPEWQKGDGNTNVVSEAKTYCYNTFPQAPCWNICVFDFPICKETAIQWLKNFIRYRLQLFGPYQDSIEPKHDSPIYHSTISSSLNIGLITPHDVIDCLHSYMTTTVPMNSYEGFLRQIVGWREYERYIYIQYSDEMKSSNYFANTKNLNKKIWWKMSQEHSLKPLSDALYYIRRDAYISHIWRLMVLLNWMTLSEIKPSEITEWFKNMFIDGYDWVMVANCITMGYSDKRFMRKPYLSNSNYIVKQGTAGRYSRDEQWAKQWDKLFKDFINKKKDKLKHTIYIYQAD